MFGLVFIVAFALLAAAASFRRSVPLQAATVVQDADRRR
jgi:hypothetical protein